MRGDLAVVSRALFGEQIISGASAALIGAGVLSAGTLIDPEPVTKTLGTIAVILAAASLVSIFASNDLQNVNNGIVRSGALTAGGSITASPTSVTIHSGNGNITTVHTVIPFVAQISLGTWANHNLQPGYPTP
jgi:hypothetical protein